MHAEVALGVEMTVRQDASLTPPVESLSFFVVEKSHDSLLVISVSFLAQERTFHLVDGLLEKLFVLANKQLFDAL